MDKQAFINGYMQKEGAPPTKWQDSLFDQLSTIPNVAKTYPSLRKKLSNKKSSKWQDYLGGALQALTPVTLPYGALNSLRKKLSNKKLSKRQKALLNQLSAIPNVAKTYPSLREKPSNTR